MTIRMQATMRIRPATLRDVDSIATIMYEAMPLDPQWDYRFPRRKDFPQDNYGYTRLSMKTMVEDKSNIVDVVTFPSPGLPEEDEVPAALAVWTAPEAMWPVEATALQARQTSLEQFRRDVNVEHRNVFKTALNSAKEIYFEKFGPEHSHLRLLATHPDFQRRGAGTLLCNKGIGIAHQRKQAVTVFASPMGQKLYSSLGFELLGTVNVQVEGEEEKLSIGAMVLHYDE